MNWLKAIYWRARIAWLALQWAAQPNLGDEVVYQGRVWWLSQGVRSPIWTLRTNNNTEEAEVHERDFRKVRTLANYWGSVRSGYRFYMTSWYRIWMNEGITPWMRACSIWPRRR